MNSGPGEASPQGNSASNKNMPTTCQDCGLGWRKDHKCKALGKFCAKCGEIGHFSRVCRSTGEEDLTLEGSRPSAAKKPGKSKKSKGSKENKNDCNIRKDEANNNKQGFKDKQTDGQKCSGKDDVALKEEANSLYKKGKFQQALTLYSKLIKLSPTEANHFSNRSACYMMMKQYTNAQADARKAIDIDPSHIKALSRLVKSSLILGNVIEAEGALLRLSELDPGNDILPSHRMKLTFIKEYLKDESEAAPAKLYRRALNRINKCLIVCTHSITFKLRQCEYLALLGRYKAAEVLANKVLSEDPMNIDAKYIKALCIYHADVDKAVHYVREILRLDPEHTKLVQLYKTGMKLADTKKAGNNAVNRKDYTKAIKIYQEAMAVDPENLEMKKKLHYNMAICYEKLHKLKESVDECTKALAIDAEYVKALTRRGRCNLSLMNYEAAVKDLRHACRLDDAEESKGLLEDALRKLAASKHDYHMIIGVPYTATSEEIRVAYKQKAMLHHPDRHSNASDEEKKFHEMKFKEITVAYRNLIEKIKNPNEAAGCGCRFCFEERVSPDIQEMFHMFSLFTRMRMSRGGFSY